MNEIREIEFGDWEFAVDVDDTKTYYSELDISDANSQAYRNMTFFSSQLTEDEKDFFDCFCIDSSKPIDTISFGYSKRGKNYYWGGCYIVFGRITDGPKDEDIWIPVEELIDELDSDDFDTPDYRLHAGRFEITVQNPKSDYYEGPNNIPEGAFAFEFNIEEMPWLLNEKNNEIEEESASWWNIPGKIKEAKKFSQFQKECEADAQANIINFFNESSISYSVLMRREGKQVINSWLKNITTSSDELKKAKKVSLGLGNFIWHAFSYEIVDTIKGLSAIAAFKNQPGEPGYIIFEDVVYKVDDTSKILMDKYPLLFDLNDILIMNQNMTWTIARTHEEEWGDDMGPFWWKK